MEVQSTNGGERFSAERRGTLYKLSWSAIWTGVLVSLGLFILLMLFGTALGLSTLEPYEITRDEGSYAWPAATIAWVVVAAIGSIFVGSWAAGFMSFSNSEESLLQGSLVWALSAILIFGGVMATNQAMPPSAAESDEVQTLAYGYSSLNDQEFAGFVLERAREWRPGAEPQPINVSAEAARRVDVDDIPDDDELARFVMANTNLNENQAEQFLESEKNAIANAKADAQKRWERENALALLRADRARKSASAVAWTLTAVAFFALAAALGGSYLGWFQRSREGLAVSEVPPSAKPPAPMAPASPPEPETRVHPD